MNGYCAYCDTPGDERDPLIDPNLGEAGQGVLHPSPYGDMHLLCIASTLQGRHRILGLSAQDRQKLWVECCAEAMRIVIAAQEIREASLRERL